ncbi:MAG: hypothetical protein GC161_06735 [Planctomycetaceae bacterium]|nr:hypothetical protein [Planctomycetaceae bacterium]
MRKFLLILAFVALGFAVGWWFQRPGSTEAAPVPVPTSEASGWVRYPDGSPVGAGFEVAAFLDGVEAPVPEVVVKTDDRGAFVLPASLREGPPFVLDAAGKGWGTDRRALSAAVLGSEGAVELTVQPLYAALLRTRPETPADGRTEFLGSVELNVPRDAARRVNNWILQHRFGERGVEVRLFAPADAVNAPDAIEGQMICAALDHPAPTAQAVLVPRWSGSNVVRLDTSACWSNGPFETLRVSLSGGVGWDLLEPSQVFATLELTSESRQILRAPISVADWRAGSVEFPVPHGAFQWSLVGNLRSRVALAGGEFDTSRGAAAIDADFSGLGGLVLEVQEADESTFVGPLRAELMHIQGETPEPAPDGHESSFLAGVLEAQTFAGPPYVALLLEPGEYLVRIPEQVVHYYDKKTHTPPGVRVALAAGELKVVQLHRGRPKN